jgi:hypothetical protein
VRRRGHAVVGVEAEIAVTPVQRPRLRGLGVAQPSDRDARPLWAEVGAPRRAALDDRQVAFRDLTLDADLMPGRFGNTVRAPALRPGDVQLW